MTLGQVQLLKPRYPERYEAHNDGHRPPLLEGVHPEPADLGHCVGEVYLPGSFKLLYEIVGDYLLQDDFGILGTQCLVAVQGGEQALHPYRLGDSRLQGQITTTQLDHLPGKIVYVSAANHRFLTPLGRGTNDTAPWRIYLDYRISASMPVT
jgi:hypothetical protein